MISSSACPEVSLTLARSAAAAPSGDRARLEDILRVAKKEEDKAVLSTSIRMCIVVIYGLSLAERW